MNLRILGVFPYQGGWGKELGLEKEGEMQRTKLIQATVSIARAGPGSRHEGSTEWKKGLLWLKQGRREVNEVGKTSTFSRHSGEGVVSTFSRIYFFMQLKERKQCAGFVALFGKGSGVGDDLLGEERGSNRRGFEFRFPLLEALLSFC